MKVATKNCLRAIQDRISESLVSLQGCMTSEFSRYPRKLDEAEIWKARASDYMWDVL